MFLEDILDKIKIKKASIATCLVIFLGYTVGYFIDGRLGGDFTGWWLFTFSILVLIGIVIEFIFKFRKLIKKEIFSYLFTIGLLIGGIYILYRTLV
ncbi:hypothetical protein GCM10008932_10670 [Alkalibacterium iburiense]|uniref:Uncharacterized protein n=1 Tax=Alkalibacterium iburiense TaxID=290589 RepID=A0ABN0XC06_9LACT